MEKPRCRFFCEKVANCFFSHPINEVETGFAHIGAPKTEKVSFFFQLFHCKSMSSIRITLHGDKVSLLEQLDELPRNDRCLWVWLTTQNTYQYRMTREEWNYIYDLQKRRIETAIFRERHERNY